MKRLLWLTLPVLVTMTINLMGLYTADNLIGAANYRPFAYRVLTWWALEGLVAVGLQPIVAGALIGVTSLIGFMAAVKWLAAGVGINLAPASVGLAVAGLMPLMLKGSQLYDFPTLALFTLSLAAMANRRWGIYGLAFLLTTLNRETACLLAVVYALYVGFDYALLMQVAAFGLVRAVIMAALAGLPGDAVQFHWLEHLEMLRAEIVMALLYAFLAVGVACLIYHRFSEKPRLLRIALAVTVPAVVAVYVVVGVPFEVRVFYEAYPAVALLALPSLPS